jgi:hypothetical protein
VKGLIGTPRKIPTSEIILGSIKNLTLITCDNFMVFADVSISSQPFLSQPFSYSHVSNYCHTYTYFKLLNQLTFLYYLASHHKWCTCT